MSLFRTPQNWPKTQAGVPSTIWHMSPTAQGSSHVEQSCGIQWGGDKSFQLPSGIQVMTWQGGLSTGQSRSNHSFATSTNLVSVLVTLVDRVETWISYKKSGYIVKCLTDLKKKQTKMLWNKNKELWKKTLY